MRPLVDLWKSLVTRWLATHSNAHRSESEDMKIGSASEVDGDEYTTTYIRTKYTNRHKENCISCRRINPWQSDGQV